MQTTYPSMQNPTPATTAHHPGRNGQITKWNKNNSKPHPSSHVTHQRRGTPTLVTGNEPLEARSDIALTGGNFKVAIDDTGFC